MLIGAPETATTRPKGLGKAAALGGPGIGENRSTDAGKGEYMELAYSSIF